MTDRRQFEDTEQRRWYAEHLLSERWFCPFCGRELPSERAACCGEVGHAESEEDSEKRWAEYSAEFNNGNL